MYACRLGGTVGAEEVLAKTVYGNMGMNRKSNTNTNAKTETTGTGTGNPHTGHRERVRAIFLERGFDGMPDHLVLEFLLFYAVPRADTNPIAHRLIQRFGNLQGCSFVNDVRPKKVKK